MKMKADHERVTKLLTDTVALLCKNGLAYERELRIQGLLGITVDSTEVFLVSINDCFDCCSSDTPPVTCSSATVGQSSKPSNGNVVDLTRLVETPDVRGAVQPMQLPSSISAMHHIVSARPKSAGSITRTRTSTPSMSNQSHHAQPAARQVTCSTTVAPGHDRAVSSSRALAKQMTSPNSQHRNALALIDSLAVRPGPRQHMGYNMENIRHLMLACERQLVPRCPASEQHPRQLPASRPLRWTAADQQRALAMQQQRVQQYIAAGGGGAAAAGDAVAVGRPAGEQHFAAVQSAYRQPVVPSGPGSACARRPGANSLPYMDTTAAQGVSGPQPLQEMQRLTYHVRYNKNVPQMHVAGPVSHLPDDAVYFQPPAKRHAPNVSPRQAVQCYNAPVVQSQHPQPSGYFQHNASAPFHPQTCFVDNQHAVNCQPLSHPSDFAPAATSTVVSSVAAVIKPPSSPTPPGYRSRPRTVEHIDLCADEETTDSEFCIPVSSIVIQPDNISSPEEAERSITVSVNNSTSCAAEPEIISGNCLPVLSHVHEIMPLDDGLDYESVEVSRADAEYNPAQSVTGRRSNHRLDADGLTAMQLDLSTNNMQSEFSADEVGTDSEMGRVSADESRQMTELYFDTEDNDMHPQM